MDASYASIKEEHGAIEMLFIEMLKKRDEDWLWDVYRIGFSAELPERILNVKDVLLGKQRIKRHSDLSDQHWRELTLSHLQASMRLNREQPPPHYNFNGRRVDISEAIILVRDRAELGEKIIQSQKRLIAQIIQEINDELGRSCEV